MLNLYEAYIIWAKTPFPYSRPRFKDTLLKETPRYKDTFFSRNMVPRRCTIIRGGYLFHFAAPPFFFCWGSTLLYNIDSGLLQPALPRVGMERFLPSAGGSSAAGVKPCGEPTCQSKSQLMSGVHQCPCGRFMWQVTCVYRIRASSNELMCLRCVRDISGMMFTVMITP